MANENDDLLLGGEWLPLLEHLSKDQIEASALLDPAEVRFLVDAYYAVFQRPRIRFNNQIKAIERARNNEPHTVLDWLKKGSEIMENQIKVALLGYTKSKDLGQYLRSIYGIGPVIAAGLLAHIDWTVPTVGHVWRYAGLDPSCEWLSRERVDELLQVEATENFTELVERCCAKTNRKSAYYYASVRTQGEKPTRVNFIAWLTKRPWNASVKTMAWKAGQSFIKLQNKPKDMYGKFYVMRKISEVANNDQGRYADQAEVKKGKVGKSTDAWPWYAGCYPAGTTAAYMALADVFAKEQLIAERARLLHDRKVKPGQGCQMLPPLHISARAQRWMTKLFLSHVHFVGHWLATGNLAPSPYPVEHMGHVHIIPPFNLGGIVGLQAAWDERQRRPRGGN
jgi:hypothetical protein